MTVPWQPWPSMPLAQNWPVLQRRWGLISSSFFKKIPPSVLSFASLYVTTFSSTGHCNQSLQCSRRTETVWIPPRDEEVSAHVFVQFLNKQSVERQWRRWLMVVAEARDETRGLWQEDELFKWPSHCARQCWGEWVGCGRGDAGCVASGVGVLTACD